MKGLKVSHCIKCIALLPSMNHMIFTKTDPVTNLTQTHVHLHLEF